MSLPKADGEVVRSVVDRLSKEETDFENYKNELRQFRKVLKGFDKLNKVRTQKVEAQEKVDVLDQMLLENSEKLRDLVERADGTQPLGVDFQQWASELRTNMHEQDPFLLSSSSSEEEKEVSAKVKIETELASVRGPNTMLSILKSNGKVRGDEGIASDARLVLFTTLAWLLAVTGMTVTIGFLAVDFYRSQRDSAIHVERSSPNALELPAITICNNLLGVDSYSEFPNVEYKGLPLFGISKYEKTERNASIVSKIYTYPDTLPWLPKSPVEKVVVSHQNSSCGTENPGFDVLREMKAVHAVRSIGSLKVMTSGKDSCFHCYRIGHRVREIIEPYNTNQSVHLFQPALELRVFRSRLYDICCKPSLPVLKTVGGSIELMIIDNAKDLEKNGIIMFRGANYSVIHYNEPWNSPLWRTWSELLCNVYFFSGFFYPSSDNAEIKYEYNEASSEKWVKTGGGPYYSAFSWDVNADPVEGPSSETLQKDSYSLGGLMLYVEEASTVNGSIRVSPYSNIAMLGNQQDSVFTFSRVFERGVTKYEISESTNSVSNTVVQAVAIYNLGFDFKSFETVKISTVPMMQWSEFVTDVFEFIGLFTGICIFTLIVAPVHSISVGGGNQILTPRSDGRTEEGVLLSPRWRRLTRSNGSQITRRKRQNTLDRDGRAESR